MKPYFNNDFDTNYNLLNEKAKTFDLTVQKIKNDQLFKTLFTSDSKRRLSEESEQFEL